MSTTLPRLRQASAIEVAGVHGIEGPPTTLHDCVIVDDPKLKVELAYYGQDPENHANQAPMYTEDVLLSTKGGVTFNALWGQRMVMIEGVAEKEKDVAKTWTLGLVGIKGIEFIRLKITDA